MKRYTARPIKASFELDDARKELVAARDACYADNALHSFYNEMMYTMQSYSSEFFDAWLNGVIACMRRFRVDGLEQFETFYYWLNAIGDGAIKILLDEI